MGRDSFDLSTVLAFAVALAIGMAGCTSTETCRHLGESCAAFQFCCSSEGLLCEPSAQGAFCGKGCRCEGTTLCTPSSFEDGCPQGSVCHSTADDGRGRCIVLCNQSPCDPGTYRCDATGDAGAIECERVEVEPPAPIDAGITASDADTGADALQDLSSTAPTD